MNNNEATYSNGFQAGRTDSRSGNLIKPAFDESTYRAGYFDGVNYVWNRKDNPNYTIYAYNGIV